MLKSDVIWPEHRQFKSRTQWEPIGFFSECLCNASSFDLMLGFFSSTAIQTLSEGFALFLYNGGRMRLVINDILSQEDIDFIKKGQTESSEEYFNLNDLGTLVDTLSLRDKHFFNCLSWLIQNGRLEIRIIRPKSGYGISHTKMGVFSDGLNSISFNGSCNFSKTALVTNIESLVASCDWDGCVSNSQVENTKELFAKTFLGDDEDVEYIDPSHLSSQILNRFPPQSIEKLLGEEAKLLTQSTYNITINVVNNVDNALSRTRQRVKSAISKLSNIPNYLRENKREPSFPYSSGPRDYQTEAFENWKKKEQKGLFAMATGTGKTITSLNCLLEIYKRNKYYKAIILVPTITLVHQWASECGKFGFEGIIKVCSNNNKWREEIDELEFNEKFDRSGKKYSYIIISTYASYARESIFSKLNVFPRTQVLMIADEAHNMGAGKIRTLLKKIPYLRRIGLSATPERQYDDETTKKIMNFFGCESSYTFEYSMADAIEKGVLCRYRYYPHIVKLNTAEMEEYLNISRKLAQFYMFNQNTFNPKDNDMLTALLLRRKRIIHKAANKIEIFKQILKKRLNEKGNISFTLIYVPEGNKPDETADVYDTTDVITDDTESNHLIDEYTRIVRDLSPTTTVRQFTSGTTERDTLLKEFAEGKLNVLTSMKCLDEGVDVPRSELAIFCASTGNPRQFIQRRGRILRLHPDKHMAEIHDLVVAPEVCDTEETYKMERNLLKNELKRVYNFASLSENLDDTIREMEEILNYYNLSIFNV